MLWYNIPGLGLCAHVYKLRLVNVNSQQPSSLCVILVRVLLHVRLQADLLKTKRLAEKRTFLIPIPGHFSMWNLPKLWRIWFHEKQIWWGPTEIKGATVESLVNSSDTRFREPLIPTPFPIQGQLKRLIQTPIPTKPFNLSNSDLALIPAPKWNHSGIGVKHHEYIQSFHKSASDVERK